MIRQIIFAVGFFIFASAFGAEPTLADRNTFIAAEKALRQGHMERYHSLKSQLVKADYVLVPYLDYAEIQRELSQGEYPTAKVHAFLEQEPDTALGHRTRTLWLNHLAQKGQWEKYAADYQPSEDLGLQCYDIYARYKISQKASVLNEALPLWLSGKSRPDPCNTLFTAWKNKGGLTEKLVWDRIYLAMDANQYPVVNYLMRHVPKAKQAWVQAWLSTYRDPKIIASEKIFKENVPFLRDTQIYGLKRIARKDPEKAVQLWTKLSKKFQFNETQRYHAYRALAVGLAMDHDPQALTWFNKIPLNHYDNTSFEWHIRAALRQGNWSEVARLVPQLPPSLKKDSTWTYWLARAYAQTGQESQAKALYEELSQERTFGGILASEHLDKKYPIDLPQISLSAQDIEDTLNNKGIARALELHELDRTSLARREWLESLPHLTETQLQAAAVIAYDSGWHDRAILTLAKAENQNNIKVRFPVLYQKTIEREAKRHGLNPAWVFAITRRESAFVPDVKSPAGATGLMQLMPYTAKMTAKKLREPYHSPSQLTNAGYNIRLGSAYLKSIYHDLDENMILATAAYNAGPHRVQQWMPKRGHIPADVWVETIPFYETREYVKAVMIYQLIYQHHLSIDQRLGSILDEIKA